MANFVAFRSTPMELLGDFKSLYYVLSADELALSSLSGMLFLRVALIARQARLLERSSVPYRSSQSMFDQSIAHIEQTRSVDNMRRGDEYYAGAEVGDVEDEEDYEMMKEEEVGATMKILSRGRRGWKGKSSDLITRGRH